MIPIDKMVTHSVFVKGCLNKNIQRGTIRNTMDKIVYKGNVSCIENTIVVESIENNRQRLYFFREN